jgi:hypothetical protein
MTATRLQPPPTVSASQALEDLACASWSSQVLFAAIKLELFAHLEAGPLALSALARAAHCHEGPLARLLPALAHLGLIVCEQGGWSNTPLASRHLVPTTAGYLGDFLLYRQYLEPPWQGLAARVSRRALAPDLCRDDPYSRRNLHYVRALDQLARVKAIEITALLAATPWQGPILDLGGGAGAVGRAVGQGHRTHVTLFELPEVLAAAHILYPDPSAWADMTTVAGDFRDHPFAAGERFGLILLANVLHTYDRHEAQACLAKAVGLLHPGGLLVIHDYCPDRTAIKGRLYDLLMMLNTPHGVCHEAQTVTSWLAALGLTATQTLDLTADTSLIVGTRPPC